MKTAVMNYLWLSEERAVDTYGAFRGFFSLADEADVEIHIFGSHFFNGWLDGEFLCEGPARFERSHPEYEVIHKKLSAGQHLVAALVHNEGVVNRLLRADVIPPFFACRVFVKDKEISISWKCIRLEGYSSQIRRISPCLGWIEWCDTSKNPQNWHLPQFDAGDWNNPVNVNANLGELRPLSSGAVSRVSHQLKPIAKGYLADTFGYDLDDIPTRFFLRDLTCDTFPPQGFWRRYDIGRVRLGKPHFRLDLPAGAIVEFAYSEALYHDRVSPYITFSLGATCNLDHFVARGGVQEFSPLAPKAGRFMEIHVKAADIDKIRFVEEQFIERCYFDQHEGSFCCNDELLNKIWVTGVETLRACAEDSIVDTPHRERGQWIGDSLSVGMDIAAVAFPDLSLFKRIIRQSAWSADSRGMVAGMCSGECIYLPVYALQWVTANLRRYELTGDRGLLAEMYPFAVKNMAVFETAINEEGLNDELGVNFIDWGYLREGNGSDMAYNLHYLRALRSMIRWCAIIQSEERDKFIRLERRILAIIDKWFTKKLAENRNDWSYIGYHVATLALLENVIAPDEQDRAIEYIKSHILDCFPNNPAAPRLSDPSVQSQQIITPYFLHFVMPALIERGQMDFVLEQYRVCWGWAIDKGLTTWPEVFDVRWSHSHHWSACPTWQMSRYVLGMHPRFDLGKNHFEFKLCPGSLDGAKGVLPLGQNAKMAIDWKCTDESVCYEITTGEPVYVHFFEKSHSELPSILEIKNEQTIVLPFKRNTFFTAVN